MSVCANQREAKMFCASPGCSIPAFLCDQDDCICARAHRNNKCTIIMKLEPIT